MSSLYETPLVTFVLLTYNQENYVRKALESALLQDYTPLEIIISDDFSTDNTYAVLEELVNGYSGPHKLTLNRNEINLGLIGNLNKAILMSRGELIVLAAGDDISFTNRSSVLVSKYIENGKPLLLHSKAIEFDTDDVLNGEEAPRQELRMRMGLEEAAAANSIYLGASGAWSRKLISKYGLITYLDAYEDLVAGFRAILEDSILYVDMPLLYYRVGSGMSQYTSKSFIEDVAKRKKSVKVFQSVINQRMDDYLISGLNKLPVEIALKKLLYKYNTLDAFYSKRLQILNYFKINPAQSLKIVIIEIRILAGIFYRRFFRTN